MRDATARGAETRIEWNDALRQGSSCDQPHLWAGLNEPSQAAVSKKDGLAEPKRLRQREQEKRAK